MFPPETYQLLDFGDARRLERFGPLVLDRPCPAAERFDPVDLAAWGRADARFVRGEGTEGEWIFDHPLPDRWSIVHDRATFELKRTEFGHLGIFPEQATNWDWLARRIASLTEPPKVLNLFAYTGGSTLAAAAAGAEVVHVDSARNVVTWARRNAELSGLSAAPIRWIAEDAMKFVRREVKRGNRYDAVILDPPSYGHGLRGNVWQLSKHLPGLLELCARLTIDRCRFILLTCHTPDFGPDRLRQLVADSIPQSETGRLTAAGLTIPSATGHKLPAGVAVRLSSH